MGGGSGPMREATKGSGKEAAKGRQKADVPGSSRGSSGTGGSTYILASSSSDTL